MITLDQMTDLIGLDKIEEVLEELIPLARTMSGGFHIQSVELKRRFVNMENKAVDEGSQDPAARAALSAAILRFINSIKDITNESGEIKALCAEYLLNGKKTLFADRTSFRRIIQENVQSDGAKLIFVTGVAKSGMSYLENYLIHLEKMNDLFEVIRINIAQELDNPDLFNGVSLAKLLSIKLSLDINFDSSEAEQFKFERFMTKMKESLDANSKIPFVFIHDFHRIALVTEDIYRFIYKIADAFIVDFPKVIFIIAGLKPEMIPNWHNTLRNYHPVYEIEKVDETNLLECLKSIFESYNNKIQSTLQDTITEEEYIENMMAKLVPTPSNVDISYVGTTISDHLYILNKNG